MVARIKPATKPAVGETRPATPYINISRLTNKKPRSIFFGSPWKARVWPITTVLP